MSKNTEKNTKSKAPDARARTNAKNANRRLNLNKLELLVTVVNKNKAEFFADLLSGFDINFQTIVRARGTANAEILSLLGLENLPKAVIFSVVRADKLKDALAALEDKFKTVKDASGVAYSIPLASVIGVAAFGFLSNNEQTVKEEK